MKKLSNILIILAILATPHFVVQAYQARGYFAVGGEWLMLPLILLVVVLWGQIKLLYRECFK